MVKMSPIFPGQIAAEVWAYTAKALTYQPYHRKTHITPTWGAVNVAANSSGTYDVRPAAGEIWEATVGAIFFSDTAGSYVQIAFYDGTTYIIMAHTIGATYITVSFSAFIDNSKWLRVLAFNENDTTTKELRWGYSGFKLATS